MRSIRMTLQNMTLVEFGFLWAIFFAPWGPVLRYLGWLILLIGLFKERKKQKVLDRRVAGVALLLIVIGFISSIVVWDDPHLILKGFSRLLEFLFSVWIAAYVLRETVSLERFSKIWQYSIALSIVHTVIGILLKPGSAGMFSNIDTLGQYATLVFPFSLILLLFDSDNKNIPCLLFRWFMFIGSAFMIFISFSSIAWITGVFSVFLIFLFLRPSSKKFVRSISVLFLTGILCIGGVIAVDNHLGNNIRYQMNRELRQLFSVNDIRKFSNNRDIYWHNAFELVKVRPMIGWGWVNSSVSTKLDLNQGSKFMEGPNFEDTFVPGHAHNMYLNIALYGGVSTLLLMLALFVMTIRRSYSFMKMFPYMKVLYGTIFVTVFSQLLYNGAGDIFNFRYKAAIVFWTLMGIALTRYPLPESIQ